MIKRRIYLVIMVLVYIGSCFSANLISSRHTSYKTYIYKLSDKEALKISKKDVSAVDSTYFHTLVDSYPTDSTYSKKLAPGHYLKTYSLKNRQQVYYTYIPDFDVKILNNNTDLYVQIYSLTGKIIVDASVKIGCRRLLFDKKTQCYVVFKSNYKGILTVTSNGNTAFLQLNRKINNPALLRTTRKVLSSAPLKYVWIPVSYVISVPVDGIRSIIRGRSQGIIWRIQNFFVRMWRSITDPDTYSNYSHRQNYKGYMVFNKPKYLPGDTVKVKAFIVDKSGKPLTDNVYATIYNGTKTIKLATIKPYGKGGYEFKFFLHDSLGLKLDNYYSLDFEDKNGENYMSYSFRYEDYELKSTKLTLRNESVVQFKGKKFSIFAKGTDENDLNLQDARLEIVLKTNNVEKHYDIQTFVPDTLWKKEMVLKPTGETEIEIPDSVFPKVNMMYIVNVRMLTSDNKSFDQNTVINYYYQRNYFDMNVEKDSIEFVYNETGVKKPRNVIIYSTDYFDNRTNQFKGMTPCKIPLNVFYKSYTAVTDSLKAYFEMENESSMLQCMSQRTKDSVFIEIANPRKLHFTYNIYRHNCEKTRGSGEALSYKVGEHSLQNYYISLRYMWAGKIKTEFFRIPFQDKKLNIAVQQPRLVYPGQKSNINITITDQGGKPVEGVDLTAFSMTKKFNYNAPYLPDFNKQIPNKELINNFNIKERNDNQDETTLNLNYDIWKAVAGIDSIEYYKFIYPEKKVYRHQIKSATGITQFAPFVLDNKGNFIRIHVIYVDNKPVYFNWSTNNQPYSFRVDSGAHQIRLRTSTREIALNDVYFKAGYKTFLSLNERLYAENVGSSIVKDRFSMQEKIYLEKYIFPYRNNFGKNVAYLINDNNVQQLSQNNFLRCIAAPVSGTVTVGVLNGYTHKFEHEPGFEYDFAPGIIKMRERGIFNNELNNKLDRYGDEKRLNDSVCTMWQLQKKLDAYLESERNSHIYYGNPTNTDNGYCKLQIEYEKDKNNLQKEPLNLLLMNYSDNDLLHIYPGYERTLHELKPGYYKLISYYRGGYYIVSPYLDLKPNGTNFIRINQSQLSNDSISFKLSKLIEKKTGSVVASLYDYTNKPVIDAIRDQYMNQFPYTGETETITGKVYEIKTGEPVIGANIVVKGTNIGSITNVEGIYTIRVPRNRHILEIKYIGYNPAEVDLNTSVTTSVGLEENSQALDEIVVIGYGTTRKSDLTGSVATVNGYSAGITSTDALSGKAAGISYTPGGGTSISIRGASTINFKKTPLVIIDGKVFTGDISKIDPASIESLDVLKDAEATAVYGASAADGVIIITTKTGDKLKTELSKKGKGADFDQSFLDAASNANTIRKNFSDYAFWQPRLTTNKQGKASFPVTFPDDVTSWQTWVLAMNDKKQTGQTSGNIKSYKPLMAQLAVPNFMVENDSANIVGKSLNYLPDSVMIKTSFDVNNKNVLTRLHECVNSSLDTLMVVAPSDTLSLRYTLTKDDGYLDGEQRKVPVYPIGMEETKGSFYVMDKDTTLTPTFDKTNSSVTLYAHADYLSIFNEEIGHIMHYLYYCNEQIASKLKALLAEQTIAKYTGKKVNNKSEIERLIRLLMKNRRPDGLWGWWKESDTHYEFSVHILQALSEATKQGFKVDIDATNLAKQIVPELMQPVSESNFEKNLNLLRILRTYNSVIDYPRYISRLDEYRKKSITDVLNLIELKQQCMLPYSSDTLNVIRQKTMLGNVFFRDEKSKSSLMSNDINNTLIAYRIIRNEKKENPEMLAAIRRYFMEKKQSYCWWNTYESAQILETILPDILTNKGKWQKSTLKITGDINQTVKEFPFEMKLKPEQKITINKSGNDPVYVTTYQHFLNKKPKAKNSDFIIDTHFEDAGNNTLKAGKPVKLVVNLKVKNDADYVMLYIPIPAGCSYGEKGQFYRNEVHREYFKNVTNIYCQKLRKGDYTFEINLLPRFNGRYTLNPAKAELMYFPVFNANNELKKVTIQ